MLRAEVTQVLETIQQAPWKTHKNKLIEAYRDFAKPPRASVKEYQAMADETVEAIAEDLREAILPLDMALKSNPDLKKILPGINAKREKLSVSIDTWEADTLGKVWYGTKRDKAETVSVVNNSVESRVAGMGADVESGVKRLSASIQEDEDELQGQLNRMRQQVLEKEAELDELEEKMRSALPSWVRDHIGIEHMVQGFPLIMFGIAMYLLFSGIFLTRHHQEVARARSWSTEEQQDPLYSSPWTLIYRGPIGTTITVSLYAGVLALSWIFVKEGGDILFKWLATGHEPAVSESLYRPVRNGMFAALLGALGYVMWCITKSFLGRKTVRAS